MTSDMVLVLLILIAALVLFITEWLRVDVVALGVVAALMLTGVLSPEEAVAGFANTAVITIAALFVVGGAVLQTGLAGLLGERILRIAGTNEARLIAVIMLAVAFLSGFLSNTGTVAVLLPAIIGLAASAKIAPSKLLMGLAYGACIGGATTLIGTPPNLIVSDLLAANGLPPFNFFDFLPLGLLLTVISVVYMVTIGRRLLPDRRPQRQIQRVTAPEELVRRYRLPDNLFRLRVLDASPLAGQTLAASRLGQDFGVNVLDIIPPNGGPHTRLPLHPNTVFHTGDVLLTQGASEVIAQVAATWNLAIQPAAADDHAGLVNQEVGAAEIIVRDEAAVIGKTLVDLRFGSTYRLSVLALRRPGSDELLDLKTTPLQFGDTLLVQGEWTHILGLRRHARDFVVIGESELVAAQAVNRSKAPVALAVLVGMLALMVTGVVSMTLAALLAALAMVLTGCLTQDDAYNAMDWRSIVLIAGMLPMATALQKVGLVNLLASEFAQAANGLDARLVIGGLFLLTALLTQVLSNTATAVLLAPLALALARDLGVQPQAFVMAVAVAASMAFATPVASPTNTLVMGAGAYRFSDYMRVGLPLIGLTLVAAVLALPLLWQL